VAVAELGVPIYITETGIADAKGDRRALFLDTYVPQARPRGRRPPAARTCSLSQQRSRPSPDLVHVAQQKTRRNSPAREAAHGVADGRVPVQ